MQISQKALMARFWNFFLVVQNCKLSMKMGSAGLNNLILLDQVKGHCEVFSQEKEQIHSLIVFDYSCYEPPEV